jgi:hypothetical protein
MMNVTTVNAVNVSLIAAGGYLPAGSYNVYAHAANYGFAVVVNIPTTLTINFSTPISTSNVLSSFVGKNILTLNGLGFNTDRL